MRRLAPLSEEPLNEDEHNKNNKSTTAKLGVGPRHSSWKTWLKSHFTLAFNRRSGAADDDHLKILLSVLGCPPFPLSVHPKPPFALQVSSSAQYIMQHFAATTGCRKLEGRVKNIFVTGKVTMSMLDEIDGLTGLVTGGSGLVQKGCFVMWQMLPNKWSIELVLGGHKVVAGSDGNVAWRHTPWLGVHAAKGGVRPLRRALQGLDPMAISAVFSSSQYMGEKCILGIDCFVLKLSADQSDLADRSDNTAEMIKHTIFGYFSQRNGLLVYLEDSYLTRIQSPGTNPMYWETTMATRIEDYRAVEGGVMVAHGGQSSVVITRFGDNLKAGVSITRMVESWVIDDVAFNVQGLSLDCFIPPKEVQRDHLHVERILIGDPSLQI